MFFFSKGQAIMTVHALLRLISRKIPFILSPEFCINYARDAYRIKEATIAAYKEDYLDNAFRALTLNSHLHSN